MNRNHRKHLKGASNSLQVLLHRNKIWESKSQYFNSFKNTDLLPTLYFLLLFNDFKLYLHHVHCKPKMELILEGHAKIITTVVGERPGDKRGLLESGVMQEGKNVNICILRGMF